MANVLITDLNEQLTPTTDAVIEIVNDPAGTPASEKIALSVVASKTASLVKLDDLVAPDDNTDLNATTSAHGLLPKLGGGSTNFLRADGTWNAPPSGGLTKFTEAESTSSPNATVYVDSLTAAGASTNADAVICPKGTGCLLANIPDSSYLGGDKRGAKSVDLQLVRSNSDEVSSGISSGISSGESNKATQNHSSIGGGLSNLASGIYSRIGGGEFNIASGQDSVASGGYAKADKYGQRSHAARRFTQVGDAQVSTLVARVITTDGTPADLYIDGSSSKCTLSNDTTWAFTITVVARRTDANDESAAYKFEGCIDRNNNALGTALVGSVTKTVLAEDTAAWDCDVTADTTYGAINISVTGEASKTIRWVARIELTEVTG